MRPAPDPFTAGAISPSEFERLLDQVPTPMWLSSLDGRALWLNRAWLEFTGATMEQARELPWTHFLHPDDLVSVAAECLGAVERREPFEVSARMPRHDGEWRWVLNRGVPYARPDGTIAAYVGSFTDVTEQKLAEERLHLVLDHVGGAAFMLTPDGRMRYVNREWRELFGAGERAIGDCTLADFFPPASVDDMLRTNALVREAGGRIRREVELVTVQGPRPFLVTKFPLVDPVSGTDVICGFAMDLTESHERETRLRELERRLADARHLESLAVLAGGVAHDFNNLLQSMLGHASLLASELPPSSPSFAHVEPIEQAAVQAAALTRQLLDFAGESMLTRAELDVAELLARWQQAFRVRVPRHVAFEVRADDGLPTVLGDQSRLEQALTHFATNALEALANRPGRVSVRAEFRDEHAPPPRAPQGLPALAIGRYVTIAIVDDGDGMDARVIERLWDPFFSTRFPGRGLGLPATLGIARAHGGTIEVESTPGAGSTFRLVLPAAQLSRSDSRNAAP